MARRSKAAIRRSRHRYKADSNALPALNGNSNQPHHQVGETKTEGGHTYRLNQRHRWENTDTDQAGEGKPQAQPDAAGPSLEERKQFAKSQLKSIDKDIGGLIRAFHASPEFKGSGEFSSHDVAPEQAAAAYSDMRRNVGKSWGGGEVRELGDGRIGFSSPAGAFAMAPPTEPDGKWRTSYTVMTGPVQRAMGGTVSGENTESVPVEENQPEKPAQNGGTVSSPPIPTQASAPTPPPLPDYQFKHTGAPNGKQVSNPSAEQPKAPAASAATAAQKVAQQQPPVPASKPSAATTPKPPPVQRSAENPPTQEQPNGKQSPPAAAKPPVGQAGQPATAAEKVPDMHLRLRDTANQIKQRLDAAVIAQDDALRSGDPKAAKLARGKVSLLRSYHKDADRNARDAEAEHAKLGRKESPGQKPFHEQTRAEFSQHATPERHKQHVKSAIAAGKQVSPEVLAEYPELQGQGQGAADVEYANPDDKASDDRYFAREGKKANTLVDSLRKQLADRLAPTEVDPAALAEKFPQAPAEQLKQLAGLNPDEVQSLAKTLGVKVPKRTPHTAAIEKVLQGIFGNKPRAGTSTQPAAAAPEKPAAAPAPRAVVEPPKPFEAKPLESFSPETQARAAAVFGDQQPAALLAKSGLASGAKSMDAIHRAIDSGVIADAGDFAKVISKANQINRRGGLNADSAAALAEAIKQHGAAKDRAAEPDPFEAAAIEHKVDPKELAATVDELAGGERQQHDERETVKAAMRKTLGLDAGGLARLENANKDYTSIPGFDEKVRQLAGEYPEFIGGAASHEGGGDVEEAAQKVWAMVREGRQTPQPRHAFIPQALKMLLEESKPLTPEQEQLRSVPFAKQEKAIQYAKTPEEIRQAVAEAAKATHRSPSMEQREAGNYAKGKCRIHGLEVAIETPRGAFREGVSKDGTPWRVKMNGGHYGYFKLTESEADGDHIDVFVGPNPENDFVYVIDQTKPGSGRFDEHKVMLGYANEQAAKQAYFDSYTTGWKGFKSITPMHMDDFRAWLENGDSSKPIAKQVDRMSA